MEEFLEKQAFLRDLLRRSKNIRYIWHDVETSCWEGIYARGDRRLCDVILEGYKKGMIFDAWDQFFIGNKFEGKKTQVRVPGGLIIRETTYELKEQTFRSGLL